MHERRTRAQSTAHPLKQALASVAANLPTEVLPREQSEQRFGLRPLTEHDRDEFINLVTGSLDHLAPWLPIFARGITPREFFELELERTQSEEPVRKSVRRVGTCDGRIVGMFNLFNITLGLMLQADISWWVAAPYCRRGFATAGVRELVRYAFADIPEGLGLHRINATIAPDNVASLKLAKALGFSRRPQEDQSIRIGETWKMHECWVRDVCNQSLTEIKPERASRESSLRSERDQTIADVQDSEPC